MTLIFSNVFRPSEALSIGHKSVRIGVLRPPLTHPLQRTTIMQEQELNSFAAVWHRRGSRVRVEEEKKNCFPFLVLCSCFSIVVHVQVGHWLSQPRNGSKLKRVRYRWSCVRFWGSLLATLLDTQTKH